MANNRQKLAHRFGFTVVELLVVIVVIGILAAITFVSYNGITASANNARRKSDISTIQKALEIYGTLNSNIYPIEESTCNIGAPSGDPKDCSKLSDNSDFKKLLPNPPKDIESGYYTYVTNSTGTDYTVSAKLANSNIYSYSIGNGYSEIPDNYSKDPGVASKTKLFTTVGDTSWTTPADCYLADILVVGGGGGGGSSIGGIGGAGGGGAGGLLYLQNSTMTPLQIIPITVGNGGAGGNNSTTLSRVGSNGGNSIFNLSNIAYGGGGGGGAGVDVTNRTGRNGGSGGGGGYNYYGAPYNGGNGVSGQGKSGGKTSLATNPGGAGGAGGGGAGGIGSDNQPNNIGGAGGTGLTYSISGNSITYSIGGKGGGGTGSSASLPNTGKGGDAAYGGDNKVYAGGSGIVIISCK